MSKTFKVMGMLDNVPTFEAGVDIWEPAQVGGAYKYLSPAEYHTDRQRRWYKGICLRGLSEWSGDTPEEWDLTLKGLCGGNELLKKEKILLPGGKWVERLTIVGVGKRNMTSFIENILSYAITHSLPVTPPDKDLRKL